MFCNGIVLKMPGGGDDICLPLYYQEIQWPPVGPGPERVFDDIRTLAILNEGIARISDRGVRDTLAEAVRDAARSIRLPKGLEMGDRLFKGQMAMEAAE